LSEVYFHLIWLFLWFFWHLFMFDCLWLFILIYIGAPLHNNLFFFLIYHLLHVIFHIYIILVPTPIYWSADSQIPPGDLGVFHFIFIFLIGFPTPKWVDLFGGPTPKNWGEKKIRGCDVERTVRSRSSRRPLYLGVGTPKKGSRLTNPHWLLP
jgi:hypothetical protein